MTKAHMSFPLLAAMVAAINPMAEPLRQFRPLPHRSGQTTVHEARERKAERKRARIARRRNRR